MTYTSFGDPGVLRLEEVATPEPGPGEVRVAVHAAAVNYPDWAFVRGAPLVVRFAGAGVRRPKHPILGADVAGTVDAVGHGVERLRPGDEVYGDLSASGFGAFAEAVTAPEDALARKPANLSFPEAAAVPMAGVVALQALRDAGRLQAGERVLIVGASGGNGTFAVQLAHGFGADVTAVCSARNAEWVRSLGAARTIDYAEEDFAAEGPRWDLILAMAGYRSILDYRRALAVGGRYVSTGGAMAQTFQAMLLGPILSRLGGRRMGAMLARPNRDDLAFLTERIEAGDVTPVVDRCFPLARLADALRHYGEGHARGKVVVEVARPAREGVAP